MGEDDWGNSMEAWDTDKVVLFLPLLLLNIIIKYK